MSVDAVAPARTGVRSGYAAAARRVLGALVGGLSLVLLVAYVTVWTSEGSIAVDYEAAFREAADDVLAGRSPYTTDPAALDAGGAYVYPPLTALAGVVLAPVSVEVARVVVTVVLIALVVGALLLVGVRDWRCHAVVLAWPATLSGLQTANVSIPLLFAAALAWRYRERAGSAIALGVSFAVKPLLWPLLPWLWLRGSRRHAAGAVAVGAAVVLGSWAAIGFAGLSDYSGIVRDITRLQETEAYTPFAFALSAGAPETVARGLGFALALVLVGGSIVATRRGADAAGFSLGIVAALAFAPVVWLHYFVLLAIVLAVGRPRLSWAWLVPFVAYASVPATAGTGQEMALVLASTAVVLWAGLRPRHESPSGGH